MSETKKTRIHREFFESRTPRHDKILRQMLKYSMVLPPYSTWQWEVIAKENLVVRALTKFHIEIEVPCKIGNNFIIGWADVLLRRSIQSGRNVLRFVYEAKPTITDIGSVIRQVKTYAMSLSAYPCVVTYTKINDADREIFFKSQGIGLIILEEKAEEKELDDGIQMELSDEEQFRRWLVYGAKIGHWVEDATDGWHSTELFDKEYGKALKGMDSYFILKEAEKK